MRRGQIFLAVFLIGGFFIFVKNFVWADGLVINEFVADPDPEFEFFNGNEWVEVYNNGSETQSLNDFKICDKKETSCKAISGEIIPGSWLVFDWSSGFLNNGGDSVILKDEGDVVVDKIIYGSNLKAVKRESVARLVDGAGSMNNPADWAVTNILTPGAANKFTTSEEGHESASGTDWSLIKINEFLPDPDTGNEWVELYNLSSSTANLSEGQLCDNRESGAGCQDLSGVIEPLGWFLWDLGSRSFLNNGGDSVILKNNLGEAVDRIDYDDLAPDANQSLARLLDGADTDLLADWGITTALTPGTANVISAPASSDGGSKKSEKSEPENEANMFFTATSSYSGQVVLNEILPYPEDDKEFVEIKNTGERVVDITGWILRVKDDYYFLSGLLFVGEHGVVWLADTGLKLSNSGGEILLYDSAGYLVDNVEYGSAKKGWSYSRENESWIWSAQPTPGAENIYHEEDEPNILWQVDFPESVATGRQVVFDATGSLDPRGGRLNFSWQVEEKVFYGSRLSYVFAEPGEYEIVVSATGTAGTNDRKAVKILVGLSRVANDYGVILSEVCPNPSSGQNDEYIEIHNYGLAETDIGGWRLRYPNEDDFIVPLGTVLAPGDHLVFYRAVTKFNLDNKSGRVELLDRDLSVIDEMNYENPEADSCLAFLDGTWRQTEMPTPYAKNIWLLTPVEPKPVKAMAAKSAPKKVLSATIQSFASVGLAGLNVLDKGTGVVVEGMVTVLPGVFGTQYFYIFDGTYGVQVYQYKKDFPDLKAGDLVRVSGEMSAANSRMRVNVKSAAAIDVLSTGNDIIPREIRVEDLGEDDFGALVKVTGEVTSLKSSQMYIDNGSDELLVYFKPGAGIDKKKIRQGMKVAVVGVYENSSAGGQLWPRQSSDIEIEFIPINEEVSEQMTADNSGRQTAVDYLSAVLGGISALFLGLVTRQRARLLRNGWKKITKIFN